jgi:hypothetical protein
MQDMVILWLLVKGFKSRAEHSIDKGVKASAVASLLIELVKKGQP